MPPPCWAGSGQEDDPLLLLLDIEWALFVTSSAGQQPAQGIALSRPSFQDKTMFFLAFHPQLLLRASARSHCVSARRLLAMVPMLPWGCLVRWSQCSQWKGAKPRQSNARTSCQTLASPCPMFLQNRVLPGFWKSKRMGVVKAGEVSHP